MGPYFVCFIGNRYGYQPIPPTIDVKEFDLLFEFIKAASQSKADFVKEWYKLDNNSVPPVYRLQVNFHN